MLFEKLVASLTEKGYKASVFENKAEASDYINREVNGKTVAFGGSVTLESMGLYDTLSAHNRVLWHWWSSKNETEDILAEAQTADIYFSSVNGISENGEIINIDGRCNRVASTLSGHKKVYFVIGKNKIAPDLEQAIWRARNIAAPLNARRLSKKTPCAVKADKCYNCNSKERICRALSVLWQKPTGCDYEVILINEDLGY